MNPVPTRHQVIRLNQVVTLTGLSRSALYEKCSAKSRYYDPSFPERFKIGMRSVGWYVHEIEQWLQSKKETTSH